jgi:hypothetical protein
MGVYGGNIGPRRPSVNGEVCGNCDGAFVMSPGLIDRDGTKYIKWECAQCGREEEWPAPYNMQSGGKTETSADLME